MGFRAEFAGKQRAKIERKNKGFQTFLAVINGKNPEKFRRKSKCK